MPILFPVNEDRPFFTGKFWPAGVPHQLDIDFSLSLREFFTHAANQYRDDPYLWFLDTFLTYHQCQMYIDALATFLAQRGIKKGDVVAIYLPNCPQYVISYFAITSIGAIASGINSTYKPLEILHQLRIIDAHTIITLDYLWEQNIPPILNQWPLKLVIVTNLTDLATGMPRWKQQIGKILNKIPLGVVDHPNAISFLDCLQTVPNVPKVEIDAKNDASTLILTGGTTGVPKAAELTHMNVVVNAQQAAIFLLSQTDPDSSIRIGHKTGVVGILPLFHSYANTIIMLTAIVSGGWIALFPRPPPTVELLKTMKRLPNYNYFVYPGAEILFQRINDLPQRILDRYHITKYFKLCCSGAGPLHDYVRIPFEEKTGARIIELYGLTEASPGVSANNFYGYRETGTIGVPIPGTDWEIFPIEDFDRGPIRGIGEEAVGELCVCGPQVMKGYWNEPEQTAQHIKEWDGRKWLLTGDIGYFDAHGRVVLRDRKKQLIKIAGHSVFPVEIETFIGQHPSVLEVAVAGLPDVKTGETIKAWVVLRPDAPLITSEALIAWCQDRISSWKVPKYIDFMKDLPKTIIGKVLRRVLQEADPLWIAAHPSK